MNRIGTNDYFMEIANIVAKRATCHRRQVGCVLVNSYGHILATGYNGVPSGIDHCIDNSHLCKSRNADSGCDLDDCMAIHAEQNAFLQCNNVMAINACYVTTSPCISCMKQLMNTSCKNLYIGEEYDGNAISFWLSKEGNKITLINN